MSFTSARAAPLFSPGSSLEFTSGILMMMFQKHVPLTINGKQFSPSKLNAFCEKKIGALSQTSWEYYFCKFIIEWLDNSPVIIARTSGTTGTPKEISIGKDQMLQSALMTIRHLRLQPDDTAMLCLSCNYIAGKMMVVRAFAGNLNLIATEPSSNPLKSIPIGQQIDFAAFVPLQVNEILNDTKTSKQFSQIKNVLIGGAQVSHEMDQKLRRFSNNIYETYGMTETISHIALKKYSPDNLVYFTTLESITVKTDDRNCLVINAPHFSDEPIITNDIVKLKDDRHFKWLGRFDNVVNSGGIKLLPEMLEDKVRELIQRRYYFKGVSDEKLGEKLVLVIEGKPFSENELNRLKAGLSQSLEKYESPREIIFSPEFKLTASGKVLRKI